MATFNITFQNEEEFGICLSGNEQNHFDVGLSENVIIVDPGEYPIYDGETEIVPKPHDDILLETKGKRVLSNINVHKIPYYETSNISGVTVYIGGDE